MFVFHPNRYTTIHTPYLGVHHPATKPKQVGNTKKQTRHITTTFFCSHQLAKPGNIISLTNKIATCVGFPRAPSVPASLRAERLSARQPWARRNDGYILDR